MTLTEFRGDILDVPTLAKLMGVCQMTIYRHMKKKDPLPGHRVGGKYLFFREEVERWIRDRK
jgi:excisionase family DNA binding protein